MGIMVMSLSQKKSLFIKIENSHKFETFFMFITFISKLYIEKNIAIGSEAEVKFSLFFLFSVFTNICMFPSNLFNKNITKIGFCFVTGLNGYEKSKLIHKKKWENVVI